MAIDQNLGNQTLSASLALGLHVLPSAGALSVAARYWEHLIRNEDDYRQHVEYIHYNPVKHGHVPCPWDWPYSSFRQYVRAGGSIPESGATQRRCWTGRLVTNREAVGLRYANPTCGSSTPNPDTTNLKSRRRKAPNANPRAHEINHKLRPP